MRRIILVGTVVLLLLTACGGDEVSLDGTRWVLESIDAGDSSAQVIEGTEPYLEFAGASVSGSDGCNQITGAVTVGPDDAIDFGDMAGTLMACEQPIMTQATLINVGLAGATTYSVDDSTLTISGENGSLVYVAD